MENLLKVGYFRALDATGQVRYISYREYNSWSEESKNIFRQRIQSGQSKLYCACCRDNSLDLIITANNVVRVANNRQQDRHMESCPKSIYYSGWNDLAHNGINATEDETVTFNISLPAVNKTSTSSSSSSSSNKGTGSPREKKTSIYDMVTTLNKIAWERQTFIKKKEIKEANRKKFPQTWEYKNIDDFNRLIFGVAHNVYCKCQGQVIPFINLCYRRDTFYACTDWRRQWFFYAVIDKISEIKTSRKYQYITVRMPSDKSSSKAVIRVLTADFTDLISGYEEDVPETYRILAGYICRKSFPMDDGTNSEWINLIKGIILRVSKYGLYAENTDVAAVANYLADNHVIYKRPYFPLENYGGELPTFEIERMNDKNILIDCPDNENYETRCQLADNNEEYTCICIQNGENYAQALSKFINIR